MIGKPEDRILWGQITSTGTILSSGGGWSVVLAGTGAYNVRFDEPFAGMPAVVGTANGAGICEIVVVDATQVQFVVAAATGGAGVAIGMGFVAVGRRRK